MSRNIVIPSVLYPKERAYKLTSEYNYSNRGNAALSTHIEQFDTYGDGTTQHSGSWAAQWSELTDVCLSITKAVCADPLNENWHELHYTLRETSRETLDFVLSIKYKEGKEQYYSLTERKISTSESKRYDKRWEKVESWMDGNAENALFILLRAWDYLDFLQKLCIADELRDVAAYVPGWEKYFKPASELAGDWYQAFRAYRAACRAVASLEYANSAADCSIRNSDHAKKPIEAAA